MSLHSLSTELDEMQLDPWRWSTQYSQDTMSSDTSNDILGQGNGTSYHFCPVNQWTNEQVLEWLRAVCHENNIDSGNLVGFAECTGLQLCSMGQSNFLEIHPLHGNLFFRTLREYMDLRQNQERHYRHHHCHHHHHHHCQSPPPPPPPPAPYIIQNPPTSTTYHELLPRVHPAPHHTSYMHWQDPPYHPNVYPGDTPGAYPTEGTLPHTSGDYSGAGHTTMGGYQAGYPLPFDYIGDSTPSSPSASVSVAPQGYLQVGSLPSLAPPLSPSPLPGQQDTRRDRGPKLWEFLLDLLEDPSCNPAIIRWENQEERTFRLTSPHEVSLRWGKRRPNQNSLPYDYFARALRYHYKTGMLISVPERKLVYKFGSLVFQQRRRGPNTPLMYPESPHSDTPSGHPS